MVEGPETTVFGIGMHRQGAAPVQDRACPAATGCRMIRPMHTNPFDWTVGYPSQRLPVFGRQVVSTSHPVAAQAGLRMLLRGGNAVDAAIATAAALTIAEPCANGLGSDLFCLVWDGAQLHGLNASGRAPAAWTPAYFHAKYGNDAAAPPRHGWDSVTVPGAVAGWVALSRRFGALPFAELLAPAIELADRGVAVAPHVQRRWAVAAAIAQITAQPGFAQAFLTGPGWHGRAPHVGERFVFSEAAHALRLIADTQGEAFYRGEIAEAAARHARAHGGSISTADFSACHAEWVTPITQRYRDHTVHEIPPNGQGVATLIALGLLEHFDLAALDPDGAACQHLQIEAIKLAFADVYRHVADPSGMRVTVDQLLAPDYLAARARLIDPARAQEPAAGHPDDAHRRGGTVHLAAADAQGMMVSLIQSNYMGFGSGVVLPGYGVSFQNRGHGFSLDAASPNAVAPGKRPFHTIIPALVSRDGQPLMALGMVGGNMQPQGQVQTLVRMLDHRQQPQAACDAPRWRFDAGRSIHLEPPAAAGLAEGLAALGHRIEPGGQPVAGLRSRPVHLAAGRRARLRRGQRRPTRRTGRGLLRSNLPQ